MRFFHSTMLLKFLLPVMLITAIVQPVTATAAPAQRKSISDLSSQEIASLRRGVQQMVDWNGSPRGSSDYRRSWIYWANMHAHFGEDCQGRVEGPGMSGVVEFTASNEDERQTWCECQHGVYGFLTWHRMYLYYFEKVLAAAAGEPTLRLPYWDYEHDPKLPLAFREPTYVDAGVTRSNPLYVLARRSRLNAGTAGLDPTTTTSAQAFLLADYWDASGGFSHALEGSPHGAVHCAIGIAGCQTGLMGAVPSSALDPIFYLHHANIDRLYDCWLKPDLSHRLPSDAARLDDKYSFPDGTGQIVTRRVGDMLEAGPLGYTYSRAAICPASPRPRGAAFQAVPQRSTFTIGGPASIGPAGAATGLDLGLEARTAIRSSPFLSGTPATQALAIKGIAYDHAPASLYKVYLVRGSLREQIGTLSFFSDDHAMAMGEHHSGGSRDAVFPLGTTLRRLRIDRLQAAQVQLAFEPATGIAGDSANDAAAINTGQDNLRYSSVELITARP